MSVEKKKYIAINKEIYSILADNYYEELQNKQNYKQIINSICNKIFNTYVDSNNRKPVSILELGPGLGKALSLFSIKYKCNVVGIELSPKMAEKAKKNAPRAAIINDDINNIDNLLKNQFDIIFVNAVIHLFPRRDAIKLMEKIHRWLRDEGFLYLSTTLHEVATEGFFAKSNCNSRLKRFRRKYSEMDFKELVSSAGFRITSEWESPETKKNKHWINLICAKKWRTNL